MPNKHKKLLSLALLVLIVGCHYDPHAHFYTTHKPVKQDVVGLYELKSETLLKSDLTDLHGRRCALELRADGTFSATNVPPWDMELPDAHFFDMLLSGSGSWRIETVGTVDNGWQSKTVWGVYLDSPTVKLAAANLTGRKPPYGLIFTLGDPDSGEALILERIK